MKGLSVFARGVSGLVILSVLLLSAGSCGSGEKGAGDALADIHDAGADTETYTRGEILVDAVFDAAPDAKMDTLSDTIPDGFSDTVPDGFSDTVPDSLSDTIPDSLSDTIPDGLSDTVPDSLPDLTPDIPTEVLPDVCIPDCEGTLCGDDGCGGSCGECAPFSVVLVPDTQYYSAKLPDGPANTYYKQTQWIVDHRDEMNIQFAVHLGDVTHNNTVNEWEVADGAHDILDAADMPYTMVPGNHDYYPSATFSRGQTLFNDYFGPDRFQGEPWYGGFYGSGNESNYALFDVGGLEFLVLSVEHAPRKDVLCWASDVIAAHPTRRVIIATHCYLTHGGVYTMGCATGYDIPGSSGLTVWEELASRHSNVIMVVCGHVGDSEYVPVAGNAGNTVHQMLVDYQFEASCGAAPCSNSCSAGLYTGNGWLRRLIFDPAEDMIHAETFTVEVGNPVFFPQDLDALFCSDLNTNGKNHYDSDPAGPDHSFAFGCDLSTPLPPYQYVPPESAAFNDRTVNTVDTGEQEKPVIAMNGDGDMVVVWEDDSSEDDGEGNHDIFARGFLPGGCESFGDVMVGAAPGQQSTPAVAMDSVGGFVVAWRDDTDDNGIGQIYAAGFDSNGVGAFPPMTVNSVASGEQLNPSVGMAASGSFVVAWEDDSSAADGAGNHDIHARVFHADGTEKVAQLTVNQDTAGQQRSPSVAMAADGSFVVTWEDDKDSNGLFQIYARGFSGDGTPTFGPFTVNSVNTGQQLAPAVAMAPTGGFVIVWEDDSSSADGDGNFDIYARGFDAAGAELMPDLMINSSTAGQQLAPSVSMRLDGGFVVAWEDDGDDNGWFQIYARGFDSLGSEVLGEKTVNKESEGQQLMPAAATDASGTFVVAWRDDMDKNGYGQIMTRGLDW